jgi:lipid A 3-O-deacylase
LQPAKLLSKFMLALIGLTGAAAAQPGPVSSMTAAKTNPVQQESKPWNFGVLTQGGFGITENRGDFKFFSAGVHAGKILTPTVGHGMIRGNFELGVEIFPFWQSYTPKFQRQTCIAVSPGSSIYQCSPAFTVGGKFTGASITPDILRWNFAGTRRVAPWIQGAGGLLWTNHKYPAVGGAPVCLPGPCTLSLSGSAISNNGTNTDASVWNFTPQFGIGAHYFISRNRSLDFGANAVHISSASLGDKNPGVNASVQFTLGYSWWK